MNEVTPELVITLRYLSSKYVQWTLTEIYFMLRRPREETLLLLLVQVGKCQVGKLNQFYVRRTDLHEAYLNARSI